MSRPRQQAYRSSALSELTRQLMYAPQDKRAEVVRHAERLHDELNPGNNYPLDFVVFRLTDRRVPQRDNVMLVGEAICPDLRLMIDALSRSITLPCDPHDPGMTTAELAQSLGVSTKTIARWRDAGLRWRWGVRDGKPTVLMTKSAVEAFKQSQGGRVAAASTFSRLSDDEKNRLIQTAKRLAKSSPATPQAIFQKLAKASGRSLESIRVLVHEHDQQHPEQAVFTDRTGPLTEHQKSVINRAYRRGITVSAMCQRFNKTRSTIYRAIHEGRAGDLAKLTLSAVYLPIFDREDADEVLMRPIASQGKARRLGAEVIAAIPLTLRAIYDRPIEPDDVVRSRIVRYNFLKHRAIKLQQAILSAPPRARDLDQFDQLLERIKQARGEVIAAVIPVALSVVRRQLTGDRRDQHADLASLLARAHGVLLEEIDRYDPSVAHPFESVFTNRLLRVLTKPPKREPGKAELDLMDQLSKAGFNPSSRT